MLAQGVCPLLISGPLGAGKTTLIRSIVANLPGGEEAEVSSPSFNLVNVYPTQPEVVHIDLYRLGQYGMDESLAEYLDSEQAILLVEWAEFLPDSVVPENSIRLTIELSGENRVIYLKAGGDWAKEWFQRMKSANE
jgi:tRNA threonylcarbamoyladenosine biosynthesis protein TsaE